MQISAGQILFFFTCLWLVILLWPKMGLAVGRRLTRHATGLREELYPHIRKGVAGYSDRVSGPDYSGVQFHLVDLSEALLKREEDTAHDERLSNVVG